MREHMRSMGLQVEEEIEQDAPVTEESKQISEEFSSKPVSQTDLELSEKFDKYKNPKGPGLNSEKYQSTNENLQKLALQSYELSPISNQKLSNFEEIATPSIRQMGAGIRRVESQERLPIMKTIEDLLKNNIVQGAAPNHQKAWNNLK